MVILNRFNRLLVAVAVPVFGIGVVNAQEGVVLEELVVVGAAAQNRSALAAKESASGIADFLSQDDLGRTPDLNIADSLRRAPGVHTIFDEDEGRYVSVRGLEANFTYIAIDGSLIASVDRNSRRINTEMISPSAVKRLEVHKTLSADMDGNAIGGYVNLVTRSAYDSKDTYLVTSLMLGDHTSDDMPSGEGDKLSPRFDAAYSTVFGSNDQFGVVIAGTYFDKIRDQSKNFPQFSVNPNNGQRVPDVYYPIDYSNKIERQSILGKFEYRPSDQAYGYVQLHHFDYQYNEQRHYTTLNGVGSTLDPQSGARGSYGEGRSRYRYNDFPLNLTVNNLQGFFEFDLNETSSLDLTYQHSEGTNDEPSNESRWTTGNRAELGFGFVTAGGEDGSNTIENFNVGYYGNLDNYTLESYRPSRFIMDETVDEFKVNYKKDLNDVWSVKAGVKWRDLEKRFDNNQMFYSYVGSSPLTGGQFQLAGNGYESANQSVNGGRLNPVFFDDSLFRNFFASNRSSFVLDEIGSSRTSQQSDFTLNEQVTAGYVMAERVTDKWTIRGGVRLEQTDVDSTSFENNAGDFSRVNRSSSYTDVLPSILATYQLTDDQRIRLGVSQALGRPNHTDIARGESRTDRSPTLVQLSQGNPELDPRKSTNFDISYDYFIDEGRAFSVAAFNKNISDQIFSGTETSVVNGIQFDITRPNNVASADVSGIELMYVDDRFESLPAPFDGLGIMLNATFIDGSQDVPMSSGEIRDVDLLQQPSEIFNTALLYEYGPFQAKLTHSYVGDWKTVVSTSSPERDRYQDDYSQFDANFRYAINDNMTFTLEGRNLTNAVRVEKRGDGTTYETNEFGKSFWVGFSYSL